MSESAEQRSKGISQFRTGSDGRRNSQSYPALPLTIMAQAEVTVPPTDERTPLLAQNDVENPTSAADDDDDTPPDVQKKASWWTTAWYTVLGVLGVLFAVIFIKGFIDADDVEVSAALVLVMTKR